MLRGGNLSRSRSGLTCEQIAFLSLLKHSLREMEGSASLLGTKESFQTEKPGVSRASKFHTIKRKCSKEDSNLHRFPY